jgi:group II intron reverse transcriptase/maturase
MTGAQEPESVSTKCQRIAQLARERPELAFTSLNHLIDHDWLLQAFYRTRQDAAPGVDGQTAQQYAEDLAANLDSLWEEAKSGRYRAPPVRRVYIPQGDGQRTRPIGLPTFEDKVLQRAVAMALEPIDEQDFHPHSYAFRPGRSAHQALEELRQRLQSMGGGWVLEVDIQSFFDTMGWSQLRQRVQQRVKDGVITRLIDKGLKAGVMEDGQWHATQAGSPQGGVISPILSNIYLHHVLDEWFEDEVKSRLLGQGFLIRYADDAVWVFANEQDARRVLEVLPKRFERFGLELHPSKTRLVYFKPPRDGRQDETFDLLGFTHYWGKSRAGGGSVKRKTARDRFRRSLKRIGKGCQTYRHRPIREQHQRLCQKVNGHFAYFGVRGNLKALRAFRFRVERWWVKGLCRRSQRHRLPWDKAARLLELLPLPTARLVPR